MQPGFDIFYKNYIDSLKADFATLAKHPEVSGRSLVGEVKILKATLAQLVEQLICNQ